MENKEKLELLGRAFAYGEIDELSKRVDKHNSMVERTYNLESRVSVLESKKGA